MNRFNPSNPWLYDLCKFLGYKPGKCTSIACQLAEGLEQGHIEESSVRAFPIDYLEDLRETLSTCEKSSNVERLAARASGSTTSMH